MSTLSPEDEINRLAARIRAGEDPTPEEMHAAIKRMRSERATVTETAEGKKKTKAAPVDLAALFASIKQPETKE